MKSFSTRSRSDGRNEVGVVRLARRQQLDDVGVALNVFEDLLLQLEAHLVLDRHAPLQDLDGDLAAEGGLRFDPDLLAEVGLGEAARAELDRQPGVVDHERVAARAGDAGDRGGPLRGTGPGGDHGWPGGIHIAGAAPAAGHQSRRRETGVRHVSSLSSGQYESTTKSVLRIHENAGATLFSGVVARSLVHQGTCAASAEIDRNQVRTLVRRDHQGLPRQRHHRF